MRRFIKSIIHGLILGFTLHANADIEIRPETKDHPGSYREWSQDFLRFEPEQLKGLTAMNLARMPFDDRLLRYAYISVFLRNIREPDTLDVEENLVLEDMRKRGDSITPLLLELAGQNQETMFESALLDKIAEVGTVDLYPYLQYARILLRERTQTMNSSLAQCASMLLANHGTKQDLALLEQVIEKRSYTAPGVKKSLRVLEKRLERLEISRPTTRPTLKTEAPRPHFTEEVLAVKPKNQTTAIRDWKISFSSQHWKYWFFFGIGIAAIVIWCWKSKARRW